MILVQKIIPLIMGYFLCIKIAANINSVSFLNKQNYYYLGKHIMSKMEIAIYHICVTFRIV